MADETDTGLPASIEAAWGLSERPKKGPKRGLSLKRIVDAGVKIADTEDLAAVSMSRVAAELGASTMSLYRYVAAKDELLTLMVDAAYGPPPATPTPDEDWRAGLSRWAWAERAVLHRHPWILRVPITGPPTTPNAVSWLEQGLRCLSDTSLGQGERLSVILLVDSFVRSEATLAASINATFQAAGLTAQEAMSAWGRLLARVTDPDRFPAIRAAIASGVVDAPDHPDAEFIFGLERILDGVEVLASART